MKPRCYPVYVCCLLLSLTVTFPSVVAGAKLYKYRKSDGSWAFSDRPLATNGVPIAVRQVAVDRRQERFFIQERGTRERSELYAVNEFPGPVEVELSVTEQQNVSLEQSLPARWVIPGCSEERLVVLTPENPEQPMTYRYQERHVLGAPAVQHRPFSPYRVPFIAGRSFRVSQAFRGKTSHNGPLNSYAVDIGMPEGTPVSAARAGIIMEAAFDFYEGGLNRERFGHKTNLVRILHDDGTMAVYAHLRLESVRYPMGVRVEAGDVIALSGNTGYTSGPHLHFAVQRNRGLQLESIPFQFADPRGRGVTPTTGMQLTAIR